MAATAQGGRDLIKRTVEQIQKDFYPGQTADNGGDPQTVQNFFPPAMAGFWSLLRECQIADGKFNRAEKEQIATVISFSNECKFCCASHSNFAAAAGADGEGLRAAVAANDPSLFKEERMKKVGQWVKDCQKKASPALKEAPPFSLDEAPEVIGTAFTFNYINRVVDKFLTEGLVLPLLPWPVRFLLHALPFLQKPFLGMFAGMVGKHIKEVGPVKQGEAVCIVGTDAKPPPGFEWSEKSVSIAKAFTYWCRAMDDLAKEYIPPEVTDFVGKYIDENYKGEDPPISRNWVFQAAEESGLSEAYQSATRFMLLMSFARFQIDGAIKADLKKHFPDFQTQRAMGMWAAHKTATAISKWEGESVMRMSK
ncbi:unnamed protein product [Ostreobium quekettii]|uniref:Carboxymuconolactone decarboxylase-like domain-containing protein n=1 Tax=Ostreobium quekettii TaxID=121088 RepID=A0A8S1JCW8_9CHLO|nr:unnamed protein product [Ostreobium quekettii]|eukprot:evm.model.scf_23.6 EVM.evm.TU.scf_23.6   scf_23:48559-53477(-)